MTDTPEHLAKRAAYAATVKGLYGLPRAIGFVACLAGTLVLIWGRMVAGAPTWAAPVGLVTIGAGWVLFAYVIIQRTRYVRAHPFDPQS